MKISHLLSLAAISAPGFALAGEASTQVRAADFLRGLQNLAVTEGSSLEDVVDRYVNATPAERTAVDSFIGKEVSKLKLGNLSAKSPGTVAIYDTGWYD